MGADWFVLLLTFVLGGAVAVFALLGRCHGRGYPFRSWASRRCSAVVILLLATISAAVGAVLQFPAHGAVPAWSAVAIPATILLRGVLNPDIKSLGSHGQSLLGAVVSGGVVPLLQSLDKQMNEDRDAWVSKAIADGTPVPIRFWPPEHLIMMAEFIRDVIQLAINNDKKRMPQVDVHIRDVRRFITKAEKAKLPQDRYASSGDAQTAYRELIGHVYKWGLVKTYAKRLVDGPALNAA
jgi:hypothetical protein